MCFVHSLLQPTCCIWPHGPLRSYRLSQLLAVLQRDWALSSGGTERWFLKQPRIRGPQGVCPSCLDCAKGQDWGSPSLCPVHLTWRLEQVQNARWIGCWNGWKVKERVGGDRERPGRSTVLIVLGHQDSSLSRRNVPARVLLLARCLANLFGLHWITAPRKTPAFRTKWFCFLELPYRH